MAGHPKPRGSGLAPRALPRQLTADGALQLGNCVTDSDERICVRVLSPHCLPIKLNFDLATLVYTAQASLGA